MKIAIDIDEVVARYVDCYCDYHNELGGCLKYEDWKKFSFSDTLKISNEESYNVRQNFLKSNHFDNMDLVEGAKEAINFLSDFHDIVFITVRPKDHGQKTLNFFKKYFPNKNFQIIFAGDYMGGKSKEKICNDLGIECIIEDSELSQKYAESGLKVLLFDKVWNCEISHENIIRCQDWKEILIKIKEMDNG